MGELKGYHLAYVRVSSVDQNEARQIEALKKYDIDKWFTEKVSGKSMEGREKLKELMDFAREGDTVYVHDFSRLARSTKDLLELIEGFKKKKVRLVSNKEALDTDTPQGKLMLTMLAAIYEFERATIAERQKEGIAIAKKNGKYKGGHKKQVDERQFETLYADYMTRKITKMKFAEKLGVTRPTLDRILKEKMSITKEG